MNSRAFTPFMIGKCRVPDRFVMTACNLGWCKDGYVGKKVVDFYRLRAEGGVGLIVAGAAGVDPVRVNTVGMMQVYDDRFIPGLSALASAVHNKNGRIFLQLMHAGAYAKQSEHSGMTAVAPSEQKSNFTREIAHGLSVEEIDQIIEYFRKAAARAMKAGFDGVELIGSAGYLISEFLSSATNHRDDEYGGSIENRCRFLLRIIDAVREECGDFPIMVRLSGSDFVKDGNGPDDFIRVGEIIAGKVDAIDVTGGWHESHVPQITYNVPHGMYLYFARELKKHVNIPVIGCNRLDAKTALRAIEDNIVDAAGMLRPFIADAYLPNKIREDREDSICPCLSCNQMCLDMIFSGQELGCVVNPFVGKEGEPLQTREYGAKILVVGAGISGLNYAAAEADAYNDVTVWERTDTYGGVGNLVSKIPFREDVGKYIEYLYRVCVRKGVKFEWDHDAEPEELREAVNSGTFDRVVIAAGSHKKNLEYPADPGARVIDAEDCLGLDTIPGRNIVIIGTGYRTVEIAQYCIKTPKTGDKEIAFLTKYDSAQVDFAKRSMGWGDSNITILSPGRSVGAGFGKSTKWMMVSSIKREGVTVEEQAQILRIANNYVVYKNKDGEKLRVPCDFVIACDGWIKNGKFACFPDETTDKITVIGDALKPTTIAAAVRQAFYEANNVILK